MVCTCTFFYIINNYAKYLDLGSNDFVAAISGVSSLSQLQYLYLNSSKFSGPFPRNLLESFPNMVHLSVGDNVFLPKSIFGGNSEANKLKLLYLSNCRLEGTIPVGIEGLIELGDLELSNNNLSSKILSEIGNLQNLWQLELYNNNLSENFPTGLRNMTNLQRFDALMNYLGGDLVEKLVEKLRAGEGENGRR